MRTVRQGRGTFLGGFGVVLLVLWADGCIERYDHFHQGMDAGEKETSGKDGAADRVAGVGNVEVVPPDVREVDQVVCVDDVCVCQPACNGKECGGDGCGGTCGFCSGCESVCSDGQCGPVPQADSGCYEGDIYWKDSCGAWGEKATECGEPGCNPGSKVCAECEDLCSDIECGMEGECNCGTCPAGKSCDAGQCVVKCGDGQCGAGEDKCNCPGDCTGGCAGCCSGSVCKAGTSNGECGKGAEACFKCTGQDKCVNGACACQPACAGKECGDDGCGSDCGSCTNGLTCHGGSCVECWDETDWPWDGCDSGSIVEFTVNDSVMGKQSRPAVSAFLDGGYVVVWGGDVPEVDALYGRRFSAAGNALAPAAILSDSECELDNLPAVVGLGSGGCVACWTTFDTSYHGVMCRSFGQSLVPVAAGFMVNSHTIESQYWPAIDGLPEDGFFVAWHGFGPGTIDDEVWGKYFNASAEVMKADFQINSYDDKAQVFPAVATFGDGSAVVVWRSTGGPDVQGSHVYGRFLNSEGATVGDEFRVDSDSEDYGEFPAVIAADDGGVVIVWTRWSEEGANPDIYVRKFSSGGVAVGTSKLVPASAAGKQLFADIAGLDSGDLVVVWHTQSEDAIPRWSVWGQLLDAALGKKGQEFRVDTSLDGDSQYARVEGLPGIGFVVVWSTDLTPNVPGGEDVHAQRFDEAGKRLYH